MKIMDMVREFASTIGWLDASHVRQAHLDLEHLSREMKQQSEDGTIDAVTVKVCKLAVARRGLMVSQRLIPALQKLAEACFQIAGRDGLATACTGVQREGTGHDGKPFPQSPAEFTMPEGY